MKCLNSSTPGGNAAAKKEKAEARTTLKKTAKKKAEAETEAEKSK